MTEEIDRDFVLTETEKWLDLHELFQPLSGFESKLDDPRGRFIATLFCYGCNRGASQTARSLNGLSRKQVAWLNSDGALYGTTVGGGKGGGGTVYRYTLP